MLVYFKILILLWAINLTPALLTYHLDQRWGRPLDGGQRWRDGRPLLGSHKTIRGLVGGVAAGTVAGLYLGFPAWLGLAAGLLSMGGDLLSSFLKRRLGKTSGAVVPGLDQIFEGGLPFAVLGPFFGLGAATLLGLVLVFSLAAFGASWFLQHILLTRPFENYHRRLRIRTRFREWRACQISNNPLHPFLNFEHAFYYHFLLKTVFQLMGLYRRGVQNALEIAPHSLRLRPPGLPRAFDGYTILYLSDLHLDGLEGLTEKIRGLVADHPVDLCLLGGDFRTELSGPYTRAVSHLERLIPAIQASDGIYAVIGNHDCLEMLEPLHAIGIRFLLNESLAIQRDGARLWLVGVDDPHYYQAQDLPRAFEGVPQEDFIVFLAHSPELYREAAAKGADVYLCGHTHGGQIQLPAIGPVFTHSRAPRRISVGSWTHGGMLGYTSFGVGVSGIPVRFGTRGEVLRLTLRTP
jgi:predicted MPP superfamily phosphohydrolase